jgi:hypothetical protein
MSSDEVPEIPQEEALAASWQSERRLKSHKCLYHNALQNLQIAKPTGGGIGNL